MSNHSHHHSHGHSHGLVHDSIKRSREGVRAVGVSLAVLGLTAVAQAVVFVAAGSVALLADLIHNAGDAMTALPLAAAFVMRSPVAERRAGLAVVLAILISALGMSLVLSNGAEWKWGPAIEAYPPSLLPSTGTFLGPVHVTYVQIALVLVSLLLMSGLVAFVQGTTLGTAMRALAVDHDAARLMGVNVNQVIRLAFVLGAMLAAASGVMLGLYYVQIQFTLGFLLGLRAFTAAVLGGIGNIPGAMAGGMLIGLLESYTTGYISGKWEDVIVFGVLITVLVIKPTGLFGERVAERM